MSCFILEVNCFEHFDRVHNNSCTTCCLHLSYICDACILVSRGLTNLSFAKMLHLQLLLCHNIDVHTSVRFLKYMYEYILGFFVICSNKDGITKLLLEWSWFVVMSVNAMVNLNKRKADDHNISGIIGLLSRSVYN